MTTYRPTLFHPAALLASLLAALAWSSFADAQEKNTPRRLCIIVAGTRPEVAFEKRGDLYIEVDAPTKSIPPTQIDIMGDEKEGKPTITATMPANLNDIATFEGYKGGANLKLVLKRPILANDAGTSVEITCELGKSRAPLIIIFPQNPNQGWDAPAVRVFDVTPTGLPANALLCVNLTAVELGARFGSIADSVAAGRSKIFSLPDSAAAGPFPFKVDLMLTQGAVTIANSSYLKNSAHPLVMLAIPIYRVAPGNPPVSLQFLPLRPPPAPKP